MAREGIVALLSLFFPSLNANLPLNLTVPLNSSKMAYFFPLFLLLHKIQTTLCDIEVIVHMRSLLFH